MKTKEIKEVLKKHEMWVCGEEGGERADFSYKDLRGANLEGADLYRANLEEAYLEGANLAGANLEGANLEGANLQGANLEGALLYGANLYGANLTGANLEGADLEGVNLEGALLYGANLYGADLTGADLNDIKTNEATKGFALRCPSKGSFEAWKKCRGGVLVKLLIPEEAKRSSATTNKCRCSEAIVLDVIEGEFGRSWYNPSFLYKKGETVAVEDFGEDRWKECAPGIHFFMTKEEAEDWGRDIFSSLGCNYNSMII